MPFAYFIRVGGIVGIVLEAARLGNAIGLAFLFGLPPVPIGRRGRRGAGGRTNRERESQGGLSGWTEVYARDGYTLRCEWSALGSLERMTYSEIAPGAGHWP